MAERLRRMLESGKLTDEECLCMLRALDLDEEGKVVTSEISRKRKKKAIYEEEIVVDYRKKSLQELLDIRKLYEEQKYPIFCDLDEGVEEDIDYNDYVLSPNRRFSDPKVPIPRLQGISPFYFGENKEEEPPAEMVLYGRLGVHWFNFQEGRNLEFIRIPKLNTEYPFSLSYYITVQVKDAADSLTLQTLVTRCAFPELKLYMDCCRIKPTTAGRANSFSLFVPKVSLDPVPTFLSEPPPQDHADDAQRFYEFQGEEIAQNHWLRLYAEFALFQVCQAGSHSFLPEEMILNKIPVEILDTDPSLELKSMNAIFHISFRANSCDYTSVVRRTTDWDPGHICSSKSSLDKFLPERIKVGGGKAGALCYNTITREKTQDHCHF